MRGHQAQLGLHAAVERHRWILGMAAMPTVDAVHRSPPVTGQCEQRADAIHRPEHSNSLAAQEQRG
jgi:hypothetical protein